MNSRESKLGSHPVDIHVGQKLKQARILKRLSQSQVASKHGISFQQIQKYESGSNRISASRLFELAQSLETSIGYFFDDLSGQTSSQVDTKNLDIAKAVSNIGDEKVKQRVCTYIDVVSGKTVLTTPSS